MAGIAAQRLRAQPAPIPIIDTHIHLFDTTRPQGVPYPNKNDAKLYQPALPERYRKIAQPLGVVGAIEIEASPWIEDNLWVLEVAGKDTIMVGTVGDLEPGKPEFPQYLERYHRNPLFRGIRYGNLWGRDIGVELNKPEFIEGLKLLAEANLVLDTANPRPALIEAMVRVTDKVPNLRIVIDHLPQLERPQVYVKVSEVLRRVNGQVDGEPQFSIPPFLSVRAGSGRHRSLNLARLESSDLLGRPGLRLRRVRARKRAAARLRVTDHLINDASAGREMTFERLTCVGVEAHDLSIISGPHPERFAIEGDPARSVGFGLEGAQQVSFVIHQAGFVADALVDDPQAVRGRLQPVRLGVVTGRLEHDLDFGELSCGNFGEIQRECACYGGRCGHREKCSAVHAGNLPFSSGTDPAMMINDCLLEFQEQIGGKERRCEKCGARGSCAASTPVKRSRGLRVRWR